MFDAITSALAGVLQQPNLFVFFILFFLFILVAYKAVKVLVRGLIIAVIAGLFPIFANMFLGTSIPTTPQNLLWFAITGAEIYFVYYILVSIGALAELIMRPFKREKTKKVEKIIIMEKEKDKHEKEKRDK